MKCWRRASFSTTLFEKVKQRAPNLLGYSNCCVRGGVSLQLSHRQVAFFFPSLLWYLDIAFHKRLLAAISVPQKRRHPTGADLLRNCPFVCVDRHGSFACKHTELTGATSTCGSAGWPCFVAGCTFERSVPGRCRGMHAFPSILLVGPMEGSLLTSSAGHASGSVPHLRKPPLV